MIVPFAASRGRQSVRQKHEPSLKWVLSFPFQPERINPDLNQKGYSVKSDIWSLGITMVSTILRTGAFSGSSVFLICSKAVITNKAELQTCSEMFRRVVESCSDARHPCLPDRAGHFEIPLRIMGHAFPAAQAGGGRAVPAAARRRLLAGVCRLHLQVVSVAPAKAPPSRSSAGGPAGGSVGRAWCLQRWFQRACAQRS